MAHAHHRYIARAQRRPHRLHVPRVGIDAQCIGQHLQLAQRLATLAKAGRIQTEGVDDEIARLRQQWRGGQAPSPLEALLGPAVDELDRFDRVQLEEVVQVCARSKSLSAAGRELFAVSRTQRASTNDADRLRKYLAKFGLDWEPVRRQADA